MCIKCMPHFRSHFGTSSDKCALSTCDPGAPVSMGKSSGAGDVPKKKGGTLKKLPQGKAAKTQPQCASKITPKNNAKLQKLLVSKAVSLADQEGNACDSKRRCSECNLEKKNKDFSDHSWKNALRGTGLCLKCTKAKQSITCYICGTTDNTCFSDSARVHKNDTRRNVRCNECSHPVCSVPGCTTCKSCRHLYRA